MDLSSLIAFYLITKNSLHLKNSLIRVSVSI